MTSIESEVSVRSHIRKLAQFNHDHPFSYDRSLVEKLDEAPADIGPVRLGERFLTTPGE
jgi:hypothetical protein